MEKGQQPLWYIIHTYSGYENSVEKNIRNKVENNGLQDQIFDIKVLTEEDPEFNGNMSVCAFGTGCFDRVYVLLACKHSSHMVSGPDAQPAVL